MLGKTAEVTCIAASSCIGFPRNFEERLIERANWVERHNNLLCRCFDNERLFVVCSEYKPVGSIQFKPAVVFKYSRYHNRHCIVFELQH